MTTIKQSLHVKNISCKTENAIDFEFILPVNWINWHAISVAE